MVALNDRWRLSMADRMIRLTQRRKQNRVGCSFLRTTFDQSNSEGAALQHSCYSYMTALKKKKKNLKLRPSAKLLRSTNWNLCKWFSAVFPT